jgi:hypothetical protein
VIGRGQGTRRGSRSCLALAWTLIAFSAAAVLAPAAGAEYEPNDTMSAAFGPLANHQSYADKLDAENDKDFFYFYATSPAQATVSLRNLGGGLVLSYIGVTILDASGVSLGSATNIEEGEQSAVTLALEPQKYFVEVTSNLDYGAGYVLETHGAEGAFGPYATIANRCATARSAITSARTGLTKAEAKLQRATARVRRSRYSAPTVRRAAHAVYRKAKARATRKRGALAAALRSQRPWCSIAP